MSSPKKLIFNDIDGKFHIVNEDGSGSFGAGYSVEDAIASARIVTDEPINFGTNYTGIDELIVSEKPDNAIIDADTFISALAEISGMKVTRCYDDNVHFVGYTMELDESIQGKILSDEDLAIEAAENCYVPYVGDDF